MLGTDMKKKMLAQIDVRDNEQVLGPVNALAALEENRRKALDAHLEAIGVADDVDLEPLADREDRVDELLALIEARISGDPWDYWVEWQAPEELENPDRARDYEGLSRDEWEQRVSQFANVYRGEFDDVDDLTDRELADYHIRSRFGLEIEQFEAAVVTWNPAEVMERAIAGPMQDMTAAVVEATAAVQEGEEGDGGH